MITLLPYKARTTLRLARRNSALLKCIVAITVVGLFVGGYYVAIDKNIKDIQIAAESQIQQDNQKNKDRIQKEAAAKGQAAQIQASLTEAKQTLAQPSYFKFLTTFAASLPKGVIVKDLNLETKDFGQPIEIKVYATTSNAITGIKKSFTESNNIFHDVNVESINAQDETVPGYPIAATLKFSVNQEALK